MQEKYTNKIFNIKEIKDDIDENLNNSLVHHKINES